MFELPPILLAVLTGFLSGLGLSIPVGPVNLTIMNEGARRGFKWAALIGIGLSRLSGDALKPAVTLEQVQRDKLAAREMVR